MTTHNSDSCQPGCTEWILIWLYCHPNLDKFNLDESECHSTVSNYAFSISVPPKVSYYPESFKMSLI